MRPATWSKVHSPAPQSPQSKSSSKSSGDGKKQSLGCMGSHHKRNEGLKPCRRVASKPRPEKKTRVVLKDEKALALLDLQQAFLSALAALFEPILAQEDYNDSLQHIKGHFFRRDYAKVFNDAEACKIYSVRYLPSRALAYSELFAREPILDLLYPVPPPRRPSQQKSPSHGPDIGKKKKVVAVGAGVGSELGALHLLNRLQQSLLGDDEDDMRDVLNQTTEIDIVDSADYEKFCNTLNDHLHQNFGATAHSHENTSSGHFQFNYHRRDVLAWSSSVEFHGLLQNTTLLTFMFVFNELFAASKLMTMQLIAAISKHLQIGAHVLLIESAGELSKVKLRTKADMTAEAEAEAEEEEKRGLMVYKFWDHLPGFEKIMSEDRKWYRIDSALQYPLEMENVGYFVRLYRKIA